MLQPNLLQKFNFFSQNRAIKQNGYKFFGEAVDGYLSDLHTRCKVPKKASLEWTVDLKHFVGKETPDYPLRPNKIEVAVKFSDGKRMNGWFDNRFGDDSVKGTTFDYDYPPH